MQSLRFPTRLTDGKAHDQLLYFTSTSLTADDRVIVFISDRAGRADPNVFARDLASGRQWQLTDNREGYLKSYVYFDGRPFTGLGRASVSLDAERRRVFYLQGRRVCCVPVDGSSKPVTLAELPDDQVTAFTHVSHDGRWLCVPTTDNRALGDDLIAQGQLQLAIDRRVREEGLSSYLNVFDTTTGRLVRRERVVGAWITHVQFSPTDARQILYNHEWACDSGVRRMWLWDGKEHRPLRDERDGRSRFDWVCHEMWERDGTGVIYHGGYRDNGPMFLGRVGPDGSGRVEIALPDRFRPYGHFTSGRPGWLVSDGYYVSEDDANPGQTGRWICLVRVDWRAGRVLWIPLCLSGSSWDSQDAHPHPIFDHAGTNVLYTSDAEGCRAIYRIGVEDLVE